MAIDAFRGTMPLFLPERFLPDDSKVGQCWKVWLAGY